MTVQLSTTLRNAMANQWETIIGTSPILTIRSGSVPANCAAANAGTVLATVTLPSDWLNAASSGSVTINGTWTDSSADATGTAAHFRIHESTATTCHEQGTVTATGGGGDLTVDTTSFVSGQPFTVTAYTRTMPGA